MNIKGGQPFVLRNINSETLSEFWTVKVRTPVELWNINGSAVYELWDIKNRRPIELRTMKRRMLFVYIYIYVCSRTCKLFNIKSRRLF